MSGTLLQQIWALFALQQLAANGLKNHGANCFFSAVLQCLAHCPFGTLCVNSATLPDQQGGTWARVKALVRRVLAPVIPPRRDDSVKVLLKHLHKSNALFQTEEQQDAQEAVMGLMDAVGEDADEVSR